MSLYTHFTTEERELSMVLKAQGYNFSQIAKKLGRNRSSVSREFARNSNKDGSYSANTASKRYHQRRKNCGRKPILQTNENIKNYVTEKLNLFWSPEQIEGRAKLENISIVSFNTIYRAINNGVLPKNLRLCLRFKRIKNRMKRADDKRRKIQDTISIHNRSENANNRTELGHWESDTVLGKRGTGCIGTHVERKTGFLTGFKIPDRKNDVFNKATIALFENMPEVLKRSFTVDNGMEFLSHKALSEQTKMIVYFCDPHCPWQRGTNENTNGLLRQYFPKGMSFADITDERLANIIDLINNRPRKRLGYKTPFEVISELLSFCCT